MDANLMPLCFGAVTCFSQDSERCTQCQHKATCMESVTNTIAKLREEMNVEAIMLGHRELKTRGKRKSPAADQTRPQASEVKRETHEPIESPSAALQANILAETQAVIARLTKWGDPVTFREKLKAGVNPFDKKQAEPWLLSELMLHRAASTSNIVAAFNKAGIGAIKSAAYRAAFINLKIAELDGGTLRV